MNEKSKLQDIWPLGAMMGISAIFIWRATLLPINWSFAAIAITVVMISTWAIIKTARDHIRVQPWIAYGIGILGFGGVYWGITHEFPEMSLAVESVILFVKIVVFCSSLLISAVVGLESYIEYRGVRE